MRATISAGCLAGAALAAAGCAQFRPPVDEGGAAGATAAGGACGSRTIVEDGEDGDDQILTRGGRGGYLYTYADEAGSTVEPKGDFAPASGGADGTSRSLRVRGKLATGDVYAGLGFTFREPAGPYDASRYTGIAFWAKAGKGAAAAVRFKVADPASEPAAGVCTDCFNDFGVNFELTEEWTRYVVGFGDLKQEGGWGAPRPDAIDPTRLYGLKWQVTTAGAAVDVWVDQVSFVCD